MNMTTQRQVKSCALSAVALAIGVCALPAQATDGYFSHGYGMKSMGMGGASVAMTDNAFAGANNPAVAAWAGDRLELGVNVFMPSRGMQRSGGAALQAVSVDSDSNTFYVPEFGYNRRLTAQWALGLSVYGNGGMNTDYAGANYNCGGGANTSNVLCGSGRLGVDLQQLIIAPTVAYKVSESQSLGVSPLLVKQIFKADGLQGFGQMSGDAVHLSNNGYDSSNGVGVRLGYLGMFGPALSVGASYSPKTSMSKFSQYAGLFADGGNFDIPENYAVGMRFQATPAVTVAADYQMIKYGAVPSIGNASSNQAPLGSANGPGFGWTDINVYKLGVQWQATPALQLRAGLNVSDNPVKSSNVTFNILAPGVMTNHYTLGGTYALGKQSELTVAYMVASSNSVTGASMYNGMNVPAGNETVKMSQQSLGLQWGWKF